MRQPIFVRPLTDDERQALQAGLRSADAFTLRRCQILLASAQGKRACWIADDLHCDDQTVRNAIHAFNAHGRAALTRGSHVPHTTPHAAFDAATLAQLPPLLHRTPRSLGKDTSVWTLDLLAEVCFEQGLTARRVSDEAIRGALKRLRISWKRAKHWITSPDPQYAPKKHRRDRLIRLAGTHPDWALGFQDETWWSRVAHPTLHTWTPDEQPLRLVEPTVARDDPDPKALACYGVLWRGLDGAADEIWLRFVDGRPVSAVTTQFLDWCCQKLAARGKTAWLLVWDRAPWHESQLVRHWIRQHNRQVKQGTAQVRIINCPLPSKSPWLNPIEPHWRHGKRAVVEPARLLGAQELSDRVCAYFGCAHEPHLCISEKAA